MVWEIYNSSSAAFSNKEAMVLCMSFKNKSGNIQTQAGSAASYNPLVVPRTYMV